MPIVRSVFVVMGLAHQVELFGISIGLCMGIHLPQKCFAGSD